MIQTSQPQIESALEIVSAEIDALTAEERSFRSFLARLVALDVPERDARTTAPTPALAGGAGPHSAAPLVRGSALDAPRPSEAIQCVRDAYSETVMAVPHYETEYGDTLRESLSAEFGSRVAGSVVDAQSFTPLLRDALLEGAERARRERERFLAVVRDERESLEGLEAGLNECERRAVELGTGRGGPGDVPPADALAELRALERRCESLAERRQATIHDRVVPATAGVEARSLARYLYADEPTTCPGLAAVVDCVRTIRNAHTRLECR